MKGRVCCVNISELKGPMLFVIDFSAIVNINSREVLEKLTEHIVSNNIKAFVSKEFYENYEVIIKSLNEEQKKIANMAINFLRKLGENQLLLKASDVTSSTEIVEKLYSKPNVCFVYYRESEFAEAVVKLGKPFECKAIIVDENGNLNAYDSGELVEASTTHIDMSVINNTHFRIDFEAKEGARVLTSAGRIVNLGKFIARGGEGAVYNCDYPGNYVVKIYHKGQLTPLRLKKILLMEKKQISYDGLCWPEKVVYSEQGKPVGFIMKKVSGKNISTVFDGAERILKEFPGWKKIDLVDFTIKLLQKIQYLHQFGILVGDLRFKNILVSPDGEPCLVDLDSCQIKNLPCPIGFPDFTAPELHGVELKRVLRTYETESYACSVLMFKILFCGIHPYDQRNGADTLEEEMQALSFPYPETSAGNFSRIPIMGGYNYMWINTPNQFQKFLYDIFKNGTRYTISEMVLMLKTYKRFIESRRLSIPPIDEILFD